MWESGFPRVRGTGLLGLSVGPRVVDTVDGGGGGAPTGPGWRTAVCHTDPGGPVTQRTLRKLITPATTS